MAFGIARGRWWGGRAPVTRRPGLLVQGHSDRQIAKILGISKTTMRFHIGNAREKTGAVSRTHMAALAVTQGFVTV